MSLFTACLWLRLELRSSSQAEHHSVLYPTSPTLHGHQKLKWLFHVRTTNPNKCTYMRMVQRHNTTGEQMVLYRSSLELSSWSGFPRAAYGNFSMKLLVPSAAGTRNWNSPVKYHLMLTLHELLYQKVSFYNRPAQESKWKGKISEIMYTCCLKC